MARVVVIGAGAMGLAAAWQAVRLGHAVEVVEADAVAGGMAAHFDFGGLSIERFYHFVCKTDDPTFALMEDLGIANAMRWRDTTMAYRMGGALHKWGDPLTLLRFPHLTLWEKVRSGLQMFRATQARDFAAIEHLTSRQWIERGSGKGAYAKLWQRLQELKFHDYADDISASWFAARVRRVGQSRRNLFQEQLGYMEGGSQTLIDALVRDITARGGRLHLRTPAERVLTQNGAVTAVRAGGRDIPADAVISTVPTPLVSALVPDLPDTDKTKYDAIRNIGVVCLVFKLKRPVTPHLWVNIVEPDMEIPGIIEYSNLRPLPDTIVYVPLYMPQTHPKWARSDAELIAEAYGYLKRINPALTDDDLLDARAGRLRHAQPVCEPHFLLKIPPVQTAIAGLQVADTSYYYPEDRGIAGSVRLGRQMAQHIGAAGRA